MKYTILINQRAIMESGLKLTLAEAVILDWMGSFSAAPSCKKVIEGGKVYYWFSYKLVSEALPILDISKDRIYRHVKNMVDLGILEAHADNKTTGQAWYAFTDLFTLLTYGKKTDPPTVKIPTPYGENTDPSVNLPYPYGENTDPPTVKIPEYYNIIDNTIKVDKGGSAKKAEPTPQPSKKIFVPPTVEQVAEKVVEMTGVTGKWAVEYAQRFVDHYSNTGWKYGKTKTVLKDWVAALRSNWLSNDEAKSEIAVQLERQRKVTAVTTPAAATQKKEPSKLTLAEKDELTKLGVSFNTIELLRRQGLTFQEIKLKATVKR